MTELLYVRHCESEMNRQPERIGGRSNHTPATPRGLYEAALTGAYFREQSIKFDAIVSSGAVRADTTARVIVEAAGYDQPVSIDPRLQEVSQGFFEGKLRKNIYSPAIIDQFELDELYGHLPGGESIIDCQKRMEDFLYEAHDQYPEGSLLIVSHGLAIRALVGRILGQTKQEILTTDTPNVSHTKITVNHGLPTVDYVGKTVIAE